MFPEDEEEVDRGAGHGYLNGWRLCDRKRP